MTAFADPRHTVHKQEDANGSQDEDVKSEGPAQPDVPSKTSDEATYITLNRRKAFLDTHPEYFCSSLELAGVYIPPELNYNIRF